MFAAGEWHLTVEIEVDAAELLQQQVTRRPLPLLPRRIHAVDQHSKPPIVSHEEGVSLLLSPQHVTPRGVALEPARSPPESPSLLQLAFVHAVPHAVNDVRDCMGCGGGFGGGRGRGGKKIGPAGEITAAAGLGEAGGAGHRSAKEEGLACGVRKGWRGGGGGGAGEKEVYGGRGGGGDGGGGEEQQQAEASGRRASEGAKRHLTRPLQRRL